MPRSKTKQTDLVVSQNLIYGRQKLKKCSKNVQNKTKGIWSTAEDDKLWVRLTSHFENRTTELGVRNNHAWTNLHKPWVNMRALLKLCVICISSLHVICVNIAILHTILSKFTHFANLHKNECWINTLHVYKITYTHFV